MAVGLPRTMNHLVQAFARLPGVGEKTALRYTLHLLGRGQAPLEALARALSEASGKLSNCDHCGNLAELDESGRATCSVCADPRRDNLQICVVARVQDLLAMERSGAMPGRYFVLGSLLSPLDGVGPEQLPLDKLESQIERSHAEELVVATPPSVEGEATALFLAREFREQIRVTRIASGVPHGGDLEFADPITLGRALAGRRSLEDS